MELATPNPFHVVKLVSASTHETASFLPSADPGDQRSTSHLYKPALCKNLTEWTMAAGNVAHG